VFSIPNTTIAFNTYDEDVGRAGSPQTFIPSQLIVGGYIFASVQPVYVRLTAGPFGTQRKLPEFFLPPGAQGIQVGSTGNPVSKIEVRNGGAATNPQFWGALATETDPIGPFNPASYTINAQGQVVPPPLIGITWQQDGVNKSFEQIANMVSVGGVSWSISDDVPGTRTTIPVPGIGFQHNDAAQLNEVIADFEDGGIVWTLTDDAANHRVKIAGAASRFLSEGTAVANVTVSATTEATATTICSAGAVTFDGSTPAIIECFAPDFDAGAATYDITFVLYDGASSIGQLGEIISSTASTDRRSFFSTTRLTPSAASHTYSFRAFRAATNVTVHAGGGGVGVRFPASIRVYKDA
jgi:hypothetical protein